MCDTRSIIYPQGSPWNNIWCVGKELRTHGPKYSLWVEGPDLPNRTRGVPDRLWEVPDIDIGYPVVVICSNVADETSIEQIFEPLALFRRSKHVCSIETAAMYWKKPTSKKRPGKTKGRIHR